MAEDGSVKHPSSNSVFFPTLEYNDSAHMIEHFPGEGIPFLLIFYGIQNMFAEESAMKGWEESGVFATRTSCSNTLAYTI